MNKLILITMMALGIQAHADGFRCETESGLSIQVYNQTNPAFGTRSGAVMVVADQKIQFGNKTIATFLAEKRTLSSQELTYVGKVDLRVVETRRKGELIAGTKLGYVDQIALTVDFSYSRPQPHGTVLAGELAVLKRDSTVMTEGAVCERYLKN